VEPCSPGSSSPSRGIIALLLGACPLRTNATSARTSAIVIVGASARTSAIVSVGAR
jgi:hypothetical protein